MFPAQIGKTEGMICNTVAYYIDQDPSPMLTVFETESKAEAWSKERLTPMIKETPCLKGKVRENRAKDSENKILFKDFAGGYLAITGAGSEAELSSRPVRIVLLDELDKYKSIRAGDPEELAFNRTITYTWNRKKIRVSTPRDEINSRIEKAYKDSDMRKYYVPCPECGGYQVLQHKRLKWIEKEGKENQVESVWYQCEFCNAAIDHRHKTNMLLKGEWRAEKEFNGHAGFWINALYSPWIHWKEYAEHWLKSHSVPDKLKTFVNEWLAETWKETYTKIDENALFGRREDYGPQVPTGVGILTAGVDVQDNRIEASVWGFGKNEQSWLIEHQIFYGDPSQSESDCWRELEKFLLKDRYHECGKAMKLSSVFIDSGFLTQVVYRFCAGKQGRRLFAIKGEEGRRRYVIDRPKRKNKADLVIVAVDMIKEILHTRLKIRLNEEQSVIPFGYIHFPMGSGTDISYFQQLTNEVPTVKKDKSGRSVRTWFLPHGKNAEAWDCFVYAYGAFTFLRIRDMNKIVAQYQGEKKLIEPKPEPETPQPEPQPVQKKEQKSWNVFRRNPSRGWVKGWK